MNALQALLPVMYPQTSWSMEQTFWLLSEELKSELCRGGFEQFFWACEHVGMHDEEMLLDLASEALAYRCYCSCSLLMTDADRKMVQARLESEQIGLCPQ